MIIKNGEMNLLASLILSVLEGLAMQRLLMGPRGFDLDARFRLWESVITPFIEDLAAERSSQRSMPEDEA